ncbi:hypothetical protein FGB62_42g30 [Gracilaria domingensis]|nr:hypothetical protein FGB62_42g30 [Gracilaria domingensis]
MTGMALARVDFSFVIVLRGEARTDVMGSESDEAGRSRASIVTDKSYLERACPVGSYKCDIPGSVDAVVEPISCHYHEIQKEPYRR